MSTQRSNSSTLEFDPAPAGYSAVSFDSVPDPEAAWTQLVDTCPDAWFWHSWGNMRFTYAAAQKSEVANLSFFVLRDGKPAGLVPLMVNFTKIGDLRVREASYYGAPLPWPAFVPDLPDLAAAEDFALRELEARARSEQAGRIRLRLEPPIPAPNDSLRFERAVTAHRYLDSSFPSHCVTLNDNSLSDVRERYRRYVKKFGPLYKVSVVEGDQVTSDLEQTYFELHLKDAGGQFRSRESYRLQADLARKGEGFFVVATNCASRLIAGMLLVSVFKDAAYDNSVAVDPERQQEHISHLLKWTAIETLLRRSVKCYELGAKSGLSTLTSQPSEKNRGISHFKEGWSRSEVKTVFVAEKFLSVQFLDAFTKAQAASLERFFSLPESSI
jgi:hypothetical protein